MAQKDYVRKGSAPKSNNKRPTSKKKNPKSKPTKRAFPVKAAVIACVAMAGLGGLLYFLHDSPPVEPLSETPMPESMVKQATTQAATKAENDIPPPPKEKWEYVKDLPEREIKVQAKEQKAPSVPYIMQCGAYKNYSDAQKRKANIAFQGLSSKIVKQSGSSWYRVVLGPYPFKRSAVKDQHVLQRVKIEPCMIMQDYLKLIVK